MEHTEKIQPNEPSFVQQLLELPQALQKRFIKQMVTSILVFFIAILCMVFFKQWVYCIGLLIALYLAYVGCDLVWGFYSGKILCYRMVCIKASKKLFQDGMDIIMREIGETIDVERAVHKFYLPVTKRDAGLISENTIMNIYIRPENPTQVQAWEIIDYTG